MEITLVLVTFNRLKYTIETLDSVLLDKAEQFKLIIWDNDSTDGTKEYLKHNVSDYRIEDIILSPKNVGPIEAIRQTWGEATTELVGKLDNDCLMTSGWTKTLISAHQDIPSLGAVACWHLGIEAFDETRAKHKIQTFGRHKIFRHPWICGTGFLMKRSTVEDVGLPQSTAEEGLTGYFLKVAQAGYVNGWYFPLIPQEHMEDPSSRHSRSRTDQDIQKERSLTYTLRHHNIKTVDQRRTWREAVLINLLDGPWDVSAYIGWRGWARRKVQRFRLAASGLK